MMRLTNQTWLYLFVGFLVIGVSFGLPYLISGPEILSTYNATANTDAAACHNILLNGDFARWAESRIQVTPGKSAETARAWLALADAGDGTGEASISKQAFAGIGVMRNPPADFLRFTQDRLASRGTPSLSQQVRPVTILSGSAAVLSFYARAPVKTEFNLLGHQNFGTGGSPPPSKESFFFTARFTAGAEWHRFSYTLQIPDISSKQRGADGTDHLRITFAPVEARTLFTLDLADVQLERGDLLTDYSPAPSEVAHCTDPKQSAARPL